MKKYSIFNFFLAYLLLCCFQILKGQDDIKFHKVYTPIQDYAQKLSVADNEKLTNLLLAYEKESSNQIVFAIVNSIQRRDKNKYAKAWAQKIGIGENGKNGIFILIYKDYYSDYPNKVEIIYKTKLNIPIEVTKNIVDEYLKPSIYKKQYAQGIEQTVNEFKKLIAGEYNNDKRFADELYRLNKKWYQPSFDLILSILIMISIVITMNVLHFKRKIDWLGARGEDEKKIFELLKKSVLEKDNVLAQKEYLNAEKEVRSKKNKVIFLYSILAMIFSIKLGNESRIDHISLLLSSIIIQGIASLYIYSTLKLIFNSKLYLRIFVFISVLIGSFVFEEDKFNNEDRFSYLFDLILSTVFITPLLTFFVLGVIKVVLAIFGGKK